MPLFRCAFIHEHITCVVLRLQCMHPPHAKCSRNALIITHQDSTRKQSRASRQRLLNPTEMISCKEPQKMYEGFLCNNAKTVARQGRGHAMLSLSLAVVAQPRHLSTPCWGSSIIMPMNPLFNVIRRRVSHSIISGKDSGRRRDPVVGRTVQAA